MPKPTLLHTSILSNHKRQNEVFLTHSKGEVAYDTFRQDVLKIAAWMQNRGIGRGDNVAIALPKSIEYVQAIFATLTTGATYIPLDVGNPSKRLGLVIESADPTLLISTSRYSEPLSLTHVDTCNLELTESGTGLTDQIDTDETTFKAPFIDADDVAAILFTSGSTGRPKGVQLTHRNIDGFVSWAMGKFSMTDNDRLISLAPFHFDLSTLDLFASARAGGRLHLVSEALLKFPPTITQAMAQQGTTICYAAPTIWRMLESHGRLKKIELDKLRLALFAGEVFPIAALRSLMQTLTGPEYYNLYGPTETNVCTYYHVAELPSEDQTSIPIGSACEHLEVFIQDDLGNRLSAGQSGEICVRGDAVTPGYFNMEELTLKTRVKGDNRSYKTGDLGYFDDKGRVHYQGRRDNQIKIRGNRIELSEIESVIGSHPSVAQSIVKFERRAKGEYRLIAYVVLANADCEDEDILAQCRKHLSNVAVPQEVVFMKSFPHTSSGKIDHQTLAAVGS